MNADGQPAGLVTELVQALADEAGYSYEIQLYPWARAYYMGLNRANVFIPTLFRTPEREALFQWVGDLVPMEYFFYRKRDRSDLSIESLDGARLYRVGVLRDEVAYQFLSEQGFENIIQANSGEQLLGMLEHGRLDLVLKEKRYMHTLLTRDRRYTDRIVAAMTMPVISQDISMAFSSATDADTVERYRQALQAIRADGQYEAILRKYSVK